MSDSTVVVKETGVLGTDKAVDNEQVTVGANVVQRQRVEITGAAATEIARVQNSAPAGTEMAVVTRPIAPATLPLPTGAATEATLSAHLTQSDFDTKTGALTEAAPGSDTASSGLNGRLQRIAQRLTTLIGIFPTALGQKTMANSLGVVIASDQSAVPVSAASLPLPSGAATETTLGTRLSESDFDSKTGSLTETAPATDTASSGLNGRLQRIAQRITSLIALLPSALVSGRLDVNLGAAPATVTVQGDTAHDSVDAGNPVKVGGKAGTAQPTAVADGDRANLLVDKYGRLIALEHVMDEQLQRPQALDTATSTTAVRTLLAADASFRNDFLALKFINTSATGTEVVIYADDGTTVVDYFYIPPKETRGISGVKYKGEGVNKAWKWKTTTSVASVRATGVVAKDKG